MKWCRQLTIKSEQNMELDNLYDDVSKIRHGKSVDQLIALFQAMPNISYVYVKHDVDSRFVTYNKPHTLKYVVYYMSQNHYQHHASHKHTRCRA